MTLETIKVELLDYMGTDLTVVNAARASFNNRKASRTFFGGLTDRDKGLIKFLSRGFQQSEWDDMAKKLQVASNLDQIKYLMWQVRNKATHFAPFCHPQISIRIQAPLAIARQMWRSHVGASGGDYGYPAWSEESRRYVDKTPEFFLPDIIRKRAANVKQGSSSEGVGGYETLRLRTTYNQCSKDYMEALAEGVAPELARLGLPTGMMVTWVWTGSLMFWSRICNLRFDPHAQEESRKTAQLIADVVEPLFPYCWEALITGEINETHTLFGKLQLFVTRFWVDWRG